jgi:hypothetical protein
MHGPVKLRPRNTNRKGMLSTMDLLSKLARFAYKVKTVLYMQGCSKKHVGARRSTVVSLPLKLVFPAPLPLPICVPALARHVKRTDGGEPVDI